MSILITAAGIQLIDLHLHHLPSSDAYPDILDWIFHQLGMVESSNVFEMLTSAFHLGFIPCPLLYVWEFV